MAGGSQSTKNRLLSCSLFAVACVATTIQSAQILGVGLWGWLILAAGIFVGVSPYYPPIQDAARVIAILLAVISFLAIALGLLAGTIGGSFRLPGDEALLLVLFGAIGILGLVVGRMPKHEEGAS